MSSRAAAQGAEGDGEVPNCCLVRAWPSGLHQGEAPRTTREPIKIKVPYRGREAGQPANLPVITGDASSRSGAPALGAAQPAIPHRKRPDPDML